MKLWQSADTFFIRLVQTGHFQRRAAQPIRSNIIGTIRTITYGSQLSSQPVLRFVLLDQVVVHCCMGIGDELDLSVFVANRQCVLHI